jgi:hypothetical protein
VVQIVAAPQSVRFADRGVSDGEPSKTPLATARSRAINKRDRIKPRKVKLLLSSTNLAS